MITKLEKPRSSLSKCQCCKQVIKKDTIRGIEEVLFGNYKTNKYYCMSCTLNILNQSMKHIKKLTKEITNYVENKS